MFSSGGDASLKGREPPSTEEERPATRRATAGLFAVPEEREVLRTPQENENSGYVFGDTSLDALSMSTRRESTFVGNAGSSYGGVFSIHVQPTRARDPTPNPQSTPTSSGTGSSFGNLNMGYWVPTSAPTGNGFGQEGFRGSASNSGFQINNPVNSAADVMADHGETEMHESTDAQTMWQSQNGNSTTGWQPQNGNSTSAWQQNGNSTSFWQPQSENSTSAWQQTGNSTSAWQSQGESVATSSWLPQTGNSTTAWQPQTGNSTSTWQQTGNSTSAWQQTGNSTSAWQQTGSAATMWQPQTGNATTSWQSQGGNVVQSGTAATLWPQNGNTATLWEPQSGISTTLWQPQSGNASAAVEIQKDATAHVTQSSTNEPSQQIKTSMVMSPPSLSNDLSMIFKCGNMFTDAGAPALAAPEETSLFASSEKAVQDPTEIVLQPCYDEKGKFRDPRDPLHKGTWNSCHGFVVPDPREMADLDREIDAMREKREEIVTKQRTEVRKRPSRFANGINATKDRLSQETAYETLPKSWIEQHKEAKQKAKEEREDFARALKRMREEHSEEHRITRPEDEQAREAEELQNVVRLLEETQARRKKKKYTLDGLSEEEAEALLPIPLKNKDYYMVPAMEELKQMMVSRGAAVLKNLQNLRIGHRRHGEICFNQGVNIEKLDFEKELEIKHGHLVVKEISQLKELSVTVIMNLFFDRLEITEKKLRKMCDRPGCDFVSYSESGTWKFKVDDLSILKSA